MNRRTILSSAALCMFAMTLPAQDPPRKSPHETVSAAVGGKEVTIAYGRPYLKGRKAVGGTLVPYGQVWRMGADEATKLTTPVDIKIGDLAVPAGSYALFTTATASGWTLIVNKKADQWGAFSYDKSQDLGRVPMEVTKTPAPVEQFTVTLKPSSDSATMTAMWENTSASVKIRP